MRFGYFLLNDFTFVMRLDIQCRKDPKPIMKSFTMPGRMALALFWGLLGFHFY